MKKDQISQAIKTFSQVSKRHEFLKNITISEEADEIKKEIFWILSKKEKENLRILLTSKDPRKKLNKEVYLETKKNLVKIFRIISSFTSDWYNISSINIEKNINSLMKTWWTALEFFILSSLTENKKEKDRIEKWPKELEENKIDFIHKNSENINFWVQLTTTESENIHRKKEDLKNLQFAIDNNWNFPKIQKWNNNYTKNPKIKLSKKNFSTRYLPDIAVLFTINSETSKKINSDNSLLIWAYEKWKSEKFKSKKPNYFLPENIQKEIDFSSKSYFLVLENFLKIIKENKNFKNINNQRINLWDFWEAEIKTNLKEKTITFKCFQKNNNEANYEIEFYLTEKFLNKISKEKNS